MKNLRSIKMWPNTIRIIFRSAHHKFCFPACPNWLLIAISRRPTLRASAAVQTDAPSRTRSLVRNWPVSPNNGNPCENRNAPGATGETQGEHESDNGTHSADERESRGNRPHCYKQGNNDFDHSNQIGDDLNTEDSVEPEHQRAIRHQGLDALCFASGEFKNTYQ
jgi:hypothetical protein